MKIYIKEGDTIWDQDTISADYIIENIDLAFDSWSKPWSQNISFDDFCRYILPTGMVMKNCQTGVDTSRNATKQVYWILYPTRLHCQRLPNTSCARFAVMWNMEAVWDFSMTNYLPQKTCSLCIGWSVWDALITQPWLCAPAECHVP